MKTTSLKSRFGFTLVELMVVISVIGILSAIVYANFGTSRAVARDDIRKSDIKNLQVAIELYKAQNGHYPDGCKGDNVWSGGTNGSYACAAGTDYILGLVPDYITTLPKDPSSATTGNNGYVYRASGGIGKATQYKVMANNSAEVNFIKGYDDDFARCSSSVVPINSCTSPFPAAIQKTYAVYKGASAAGW